MLWRGCVGQAQGQIIGCKLAVSYIFVVILQKLGCTRQTESQLSLRSFALILQKLGCTRQTESQLSLHSLALILQKLGCTRQTGSPEWA